jgi:hypothetical protein
VRQRLSPLLSVVKIDKELKKMPVLFSVEKRTKKDFPKLF